MNNISPALLKDGYKVDHRSQYPANTTLIYSNFTARSSRNTNDYVVFFGLQYFIKEYLITRWNEQFFNKPKQEAITEYSTLIDMYLGKGVITYKHLEELHELGYLPLEIRALEEGTAVPLKVSMLTVHNTDKRFGWLTNFIETLISCILWGPITSATTASIFKRILNMYATETAGNTDFVQWQGHDFSFRGMFGLEAACMSGAAHLLFFTGTDTIPAVKFLSDYYGAKLDGTELVGGSVAATEHSVMSAGGSETEFDTYKRLITEVYPKGIVSIVSDTWDLWNVINDILPRLKNEIMSRDGKLVIRPDSGDPVDIIAGLIECKDANAFLSLDPRQWSHFYYVENDKYWQLKKAKSGEQAHTIHEVAANTVKGVVELLYDQFGGTVSEQGYKVLDPHIGAIYGDSITYERCFEICARLKRKKFASTNVVYGIGSYTYQYQTRDSYGMAMKATYAEIDGKGVELFKDPITDNGTKKSAKGLLCVKEVDGSLVLEDQVTWDVANTESLLQPVFRDGKLLKSTTLSEIRERTNKYTEYIKEPVADEQPSN